MTAKHEWVVGCGLLRISRKILVVRNQRKGGAVDWSPPGGVIDPGETLLEGLTREVQEETGLLVPRWGPVEYTVEVDAPDMGWHLSVFAHQALLFEGEIAAVDPDGIVDEARFATTDETAELLSGALVWVREPLMTWLVGGLSPAPFRYRVDGTGGLGENLRVTVL